LPRLAAIPINERQLTSNATEAPLPALKIKINNHYTLAQDMLLSDMTRVSTQRPGVRCTEARGAVFYCLENSGTQSHRLHLSTIVFDFVHLSTIVVDKICGKIAKFAHRLSDVDEEENYERSNP